MDTVVNDHVLPETLPADPEIEAMLEAGVHWGHVRSKRHPAMTSYLWGTRSNVEIIDLLKTQEKLEVALEVLRKAAHHGKLILFIGTRPSARAYLKEAAGSLGYPFVDQRWIGGTLTNFKVILKRIEILETLEKERSSGGFEKYTKKERLEKEKEMARLRQNFDGLRLLNRLPDLVVMLDIGHDKLALSEARRLKIPVVALTDTDTDPRLVTHPIPSNDDARPAIHYMLERMRGSILEGQGKRAEDAAAAANASEPAVPTG